MMHIREAERRDAYILSRLLAQLGYPATLKECEARINLHTRENYKLFVGEIEGAVIGFIALHWYHAIHHQKPIGRLVAICVDEKSRGTGLGTSLLNFAEDFFKQKDCFKIELTSRMRRTESHEYYLRKGYQQTSLHFIKLLENKTLLH
jgi:N-acetylglutamate synthase and related acetyltransferases